MASFVALQPSIAATELDQRWWRMPPGSNCGNGEEDREWNWEELCRDALSNNYWEATGLQTPDGRFQGAIIYSADAKSVLNPKAGAIYVDNLATAPWNRRRVNGNPEFGAVGPELLCQAVHHSHLLGFRGRIILASLPRAIAFYVGKGFVDTGTTIENWPVLELPLEQARNWLEEKGLVGNA